MKSYLYLLISALALLGTIDTASACLYGWYSPSGYFMYRVYESTPAPSLAIEGAHPSAGENCLEWQSLTSADIPLEDIYKVVYSMSLEELQGVSANRKQHYDNKFTEWITKNDTAILDFLLLAKANEHIRLKVNSRWYYPTMKMGAPMDLEEVVERSLAANDARLRDRYLLQAVRALFTLGRYDECINLWERNVRKLPHDNLMRRLIEPYIAGAKFRTGNKEEAMRLFADIGDVESLLFCAGRSGETLSPVDAIRLICTHSPNSPYIPKALQAYVRSIEPDGELGYYVHREWSDDKRKKEILADIAKLRSLCRRMAAQSSPYQPMWYYTAAFLADLMGDRSKTTEYLGAAMRTLDNGSELIFESVTVFRFYITAKYSSYNNRFEESLFSQLKWFDKKIVGNLTDDVKEEVAMGYNLRCNESFYYWNDMMRRIVLAVVCPRMIEAGKPIRALQLANMADNYLINIVDKRAIYNSDKREYEHVSMRDYRYSKEEPNEWDYSNHFFEMIDSIGVNTVKQYVASVTAPQGEFDRFLNEHSYTEPDYLNDIVGTQLLRHMRYAEAEKYLSKVSKEYYYHHNLDMKYSPFEVAREEVGISTTFRYDYAKEMHSLEKQMAATNNPNRKAELMVRYAIGLRNSFDRCWSLTQYYRGTSYWGSACDKRDWESDKITLKATKRAEKMCTEACQMVTDPEVGANLNYLLCNFRTVAERYPDTEKGKLVRGECDRLIDYHAERYTPTQRERGGY